MDSILCCNPEPPQTFSAAAPSKHLLQIASLSPHSTGDRVMRAINLIDVSVSPSFPRLCQSVPPLSKKNGADKHDGGTGLGEEGQKEKNMSSGPFSERSGALELRAVQ